MFRNEWMNMSSSVCASLLYLKYQLFISFQSFASRHSCDYELLHLSKITTILCICNGIFILCCAYKSIPWHFYDYATHLDSLTYQHWFRNNFDSLYELMPPANYPKIGEISGLLCMFSSMVWKFPFYTNGGLKFFVFVLNSQFFLRN